jgi:hypothetical protein
MSNFTSKRRNAGRPPYKRTTVEFAKSYADHYGYEMRGGWVYGPDSERVVRGWQAFADQLEQRGTIKAGAGIVHRFSVGDRLLLDERRGERETITVTRIGRDDIFPVYYFIGAHGREDMVYDHKCTVGRIAAA